jgi:O-methyltransferase
VKSLLVVNPIRLNKLKEIANEINNNRIGGAVAELGVYQGDFAKYINELFTDKKIYLFDTFDGFSYEDVLVDREHNYSTGMENWKNTSIDIVLSKMKYPHNVIFVKGYFPDTTSGIENETFSFVSLDVDLYKPMAEGLKWFYDRLETGGYLMIHDYINKDYLGVSIAVKEFCENNNIECSIINDFPNSAVIKKM